MQPVRTPTLIQRAAAITLRPEQTWRGIAADPALPGTVLVRYALPLLAIGPVAGMIGGQVFGINLGLASYRPTPLAGLGLALADLIAALAALIGLTMVAERLAPRFAGQDNRARAFTLVAYSLTPAWIARLLGLVPPLAGLGVLAGLYSLYLFHRGAPVLLRVPEPRAAGFTALTALAAIALHWLAAVLLAGMAALAGPAPVPLAAGEQGASLALPGAAKIDLAAADPAPWQNAAAPGPGAPRRIDMATLQALLPATAAGYQRVAVDAAGVGGIGARAAATYRLGEREVRLEIIDLAVLGAVTGAIGGLGIEQNHEDANGYRRTRSVDGVIQSESWDKARSRGSFGTQVAGRFMVQGSGQADSIAQLKAMVATIDQARLAELAE